MEKTFVAEKKTQYKIASLLSVSQQTAHVKPNARIIKGKMECQQRRSAQQGAPGPSSIHLKFNVSGVYR
jgi:hypothetical protein